MRCRRADSGNRDDPAGSLDGIAFLDLLEFPEEHRADALLFQVERDAVDTVRELEHLARHDVLDAVDPGDAVADRDDAAHLGDVDVDRVAANLLANDLGDFFGLDVHRLLVPFAFYLLPLTLTIIEPSSHCGLKFRQLLASRRALNRCNCLARLAS